jgi:hypothetical protein
MGHPLEDLRFPHLKDEMWGTREIVISGIIIELDEIQPSMRLI